jgi:hypothetical protein
MPSFRRRAAIVLAGITTAGAFAAPMAAQADAAPVKLKVANSTKLLTYSNTVGFATMKTSGTVLLDEQRWEQVDATGSGPAVLLRNVRHRQCLRANPANDIFVRTRICDPSSAEQQWILSGTNQLANADRLARKVAANSLTVDFNNINNIVSLAPFTGTANQRWSTVFG